MLFMPLNMKMPPVSAGNAALGKPLGEVFGHKQTLQHSKGNHPVVSVHIRISNGYDPQLVCAGLRQQLPQARRVQLIIVLLAVSWTISPTLNRVVRSSQSFFLFRGGVHDAKWYCSERSSEKIALRG